jgi:hypothetical protein
MLPLPSAPTAPEHRIPAGPTRNSSKLVYAARPRTDDGEPSTPIRDGARLFAPGGRNPVVGHRTTGTLGPDDATAEADTATNATSRATVKARATERTFMRPMATGGAREPGSSCAIRLQ